MLENIYVLLKNADKYKEKTDIFRKNMQEQGICVICLKEEEEKRHKRQNQQSNSLLVTDFSPEEIAAKEFTFFKRETGLEGFDAENCGLNEILQKLYIVGYGLDYKGNVPYIIDDFEEISAGYMQLIYSRYTGSPYTVAVTKRLVIREMRLEDLDAMYAMYDSLSECAYIEPLYERSREEEFTRNYIRDMYGFYQYGLWLVFERESGTLVGRVGIENRMIDESLCRELGYLIDRRYQGRGFAYEAAMAVLGYARGELGLEEMYICTHINNKPSIGLAKKLGFKLYAGNIDGMNLYKKCLI